MNLPSVTNFLFNLSLPFATLGLLCFIIYTWVRRRQLFVVATLASLVAFACLTLVLPLLLLTHGPRMIFINASREIAYAWMIMVVYFVAEYRYRVRLLGSILMPVALALLFLAAVEDSTPVRSVAFEGVIPTFIHVVLVLGSFGLIFLAFAASTMYLFKTHALKKRTEQALDDELPSVITLKKMMRHSFRLSFPLFSVGLVLGTLFALKELGPNWIRHPFVLMAFLFWILQAVIFLLLQAGKLNSRALAKSLVVLFVLMVTLTLFSTHRKMLLDELEKARSQAELTTDG